MWHTTPTMKAIIPIFLALVLAARSTSGAADFFGVPDKTIVPKPAATTPAPATPAPATPAPATPAPATPAPARGPATPVPITGAPADEAPPTLLPDGAFLKTPSIGGASDAGRAFHDLGPDRGVLIGLEYTLGTTAEGTKAIESITPIYVRPAGKAHGTLRGTRQPGNPATVLEARPGFAVAALEARGSGGITAFRVTFMRYENGALDPAERYLTKWFGSDSTEPAKQLRTDTRPIVGVYGKADAGISEFGLIVRREISTAPKTPPIALANPFGTPTPPDPGSLPVPSTADMPDEDPAPALEPTAFDSGILKTAPAGGTHGWGNAFRDLAPTGALLVGFEYSLGTFNGGPIIGSALPLYQLANSAKKPGDLHGNAAGPVVRVEARPGYAVGAIQARGGALIDGFQLIYMKIKGPALDPADHYQSEWCGGTTGTMKRLDGGGQPLVGLYGKSGKDLNELGLFVKKNGTSLAATRPGTFTSPPPPAAPASSGGLQVFACADDEFTLFLNGREILSGTNLRQVESGEFPIVKGDVLTAIVKDKGGGGGEAWLSLRVVRDGKTILDAGDMRYLLTESLNWKTNKLTTGFREPKVWTHDKPMGTDARPRAAWANAKDATATVLYFKGIVP